MPIFYNILQYKATKKWKIIFWNIKRTRAVNAGIIALTKHIQTYNLVELSTKKNISIFSDDHKQLQLDIHVAHRSILLLFHAA